MQCWRACLLAAAAVACHGGRGPYGPYDDGFTAAGDEALCRAGSAVACSRLGNALVSGRGVVSDRLLAQGYFARACALGDLYAGCVTLGIAYAEDWDGKHEPARAVAVYRAACERSGAEACLFLGYAYGHVGTPEITPADPLRARAFYELACSLGSGSGCNAAAFTYQRGEGGPVELERAASWFARGCDGGDPDACFHLSGAYREGKGVAKSEEEAERLFTRACELLHYGREPCIAF